MLLTAVDLVELTGRKRAAAQCRALDAMGMVYLLGADGRPRVLRSLVERMLGAPAVAPEKELELCFEPPKKKRQAPAPLRLL
jgi:hypothetical protein